MNCHSLKTWVKPFTATWEGRKNYEVRLDDRQFEVNDCLHLREYEHETERFTGRAMLACITYISRLEGSAQPEVCVLATWITDRTLESAEIRLTDDEREYYFSGE